jgi:hypothetical protein
MRKRSGIEKNRTSLELSLTQYDAIDVYCRQGETTKGRLISRLITLFGAMEPYLVKVYLGFANARMAGLISRLDDVSDCEREDTDEQLRYYEALRWFLTGDISSVSEFSRIRGKKMRTTLDLTPQNYKVLSALAEKYGITFGATVGILVNLFISMPLSCRKELLTFTRQRLYECLLLSTSSGELDADNEKAVHDYVAISYFFEPGIVPLPVSFM